MSNGQPPDTFVERLKAVLGEQGNLSAFSRRCEVGDNLIRKYLSGSEPGLDKVVRIAQAAGVRLEWLATGRGGMREEPSTSAPTTTAPEGTALDQRLPLIPHLMEAVIEGMELAIRKKGVRLSPKQRALAVTTLYGITYRRHMIRKAGGEPPDLEEDVDGAALAPDGAALLRLLSEGEKES